jgi:hypothetical protein
MRIIIEYSSDTLLPDKLSKAVENMKKSIYENRYENDKIEIIIGRLKNELIEWIDNNGKINKEVK